MSEWSEQRAIISWFRENWPEYRQCLRVSLAGLNLGSGKRAAIMVNQMRAQGVEKGESDILIALPRGGFGSLVLEHKAEGSPHTTTQDQLDYIRHHNSCGNCAVVSRGIDMAKAAISQYMGLNDG